MKSMEPAALVGIVIFGILGIFIPTATFITIGLLGFLAFRNVVNFFNKYQ